MMTARNRAAVQGDNEETDNKTILLRSCDIVILGANVRVNDGW